MFCNRASVFCKRNFRLRLRQGGDGGGDTEVALAGELEVSGEDGDGEATLLVQVAEAVCSGVGGVDDGQGFVGMVEIVVEFGFEVVAVVGEFDVVDSGEESTLHEPGFVAGTGHEAKRVRGESPFEVGGDIVAFDGEDEFGLELLADGEGAAGPGDVGLRVFVVVPDVAEGMGEVLFEEGASAGLEGVSAPDELIAFSVKGKGGAHKMKVPDMVEPEENGIGGANCDGPAFDQGGISGFGDVVAEDPGDAEAGGEVAAGFPEVELIGALALLEVQGEGCGFGAGGEGGGETDVIGEAVNEFGIVLMLEEGLEALWARSGWKGADAGMPEVIQKTV